MKRVIRKFDLSSLVPAMALAALFTACGDDSGSNGDENESVVTVPSDIKLADGNKVVCDEDMEGVVAVTADAGYLRCEDGRWIEVSEDEALSADKIIGAVEGKSSSSSKGQSSSSAAKVSSSSKDKSSSSAAKVSSSSKDKSSSSAAKVSSSSKGESSSSAAKVSSSSKDESSSSAAKVSSSCKDEDASTLYRCDADGKLYKDPEECPSHSDGITSSDTPGTDPDVTPSEVPGSNSSSSEEDVTTIKPDGYYSNSSKCPAGLTCKYATTTDYLNSTKTYGEILDTRDGQVYKTIEICDDKDENCQTWMAQNLNYAPGDVSSMGSSAWSGCYGEGLASYSDEEVAANCSKYGRLYTWEVAMDNADCAYEKECNASLKPATPVRGVCPQGWHLPSHYEFEELINLIDPTFGYNHIDNPPTLDNALSLTAGTFLKSQSGWLDDNNGTDAYGFSALPGGHRRSSGYFYYAGDIAHFWSSGEYYSYNAFFLYLRYDDALLNWYYKDEARSVRCLRDSN